MTDPHGWQLLEAINVNPADNTCSHVPRYHLELVEGAIEDYSMTDFGRIEIKLDKLVQRTKEDPNRANAFDIVTGNENT